MFLSVDDASSWCGEDSEHAAMICGVLFGITAVLALPIVQRFRVWLAAIVCVIVEICHVKLKREDARELLSWRNSSSELTWGSWLLGFALGLRQYSSNVNGTTMPSLSASIFASNACFLKRHLLNCCRKTKSSKLPDYVWILVITTVWIAPSSVHDAGIHIRWTKCVRFIEQWNDGE